MVTIAVLVAFQVDKARSIYYKKCETYPELEKALFKARNRHADFVSIRFLKEGFGE